MLTEENGFDLNLQWQSRDDRKYAFALLALFVFLIVIYANSFHGVFQFDDKINIVENRNIFLKSLDWSDIKKSFHGIEGNKIIRPFSYFSFALNYYIDELNVIGYHIVNFIIHYLTSLFLFLFTYKTLTLPKLREKYGSTAYGVSLLATFFWATSPVQLTAVTYIVQRMASMAGLFYIMALYFYMKGRTTKAFRKCIVFWILCSLCAILSLGSKENAALLPVSIWLYDLFIIQGATRKNIIKNIKIIAPVMLIIALVGFWYMDIASIANGAAYQHRPFTLAERLLTQPRIIIYYITLLLYPISSRMTLIHDIELSTSVLVPWSTLPAIILIFILIVLAFSIARKQSFIAFCILFFFLNHLIESTFIPLELIYEHRNYIPSMFFFAPLAILMLQVFNYFAYNKAIQWTMVAVFTFLLAAQGHTVFVRNALFANPLLLWTDNVEKAPGLSRPYNNLGAAYWDRGFYDKTYELYLKAYTLDNHSNLANRGTNLHNLGMYHLNITGNFDKALGFYEAAIEAYPGYWPSYHDAAVCFIRKGNMAEAGRRLVAALSLWPENAELRHSLGFVLLKMGQYDEAIKQARHALSFNPGLSNSLCVLGEANRKKGNHSLAKIYWKKYLEKNPNDLEGNLALLELYSRDGDKEALSRIIGKLMYLKGSMDWRELIEQILRDKNRSAYIPHPGETISILRRHLCD